MRKIPVTTITRIQKPMKRPTERKQVAAYARVSTSQERQEQSLAAQVDFYSKLIQATPGWACCGIYIDDGISGTQIDGRDQFKELIDKCEAGQVDIILTKSISRFARNTLDLLQTIRRLKELKVDVRFEKENINTLSEAGEFMITIMATFAQEESRSISENLRWAVQKRYKQGISMHHRVYGYQWTGKELVPDPESSEIVINIFNDYLNGKSMKRIADDLNENSVLHFGKPFNDIAILTILKNERYIGDTLLQKTFCEDFMTHKRKPNEGQYPQYYVERTHDPIVSRKTFKKVSKEIDRRRELGVFNIPKTKRRCFTGKITCEKCGAPFIRTYKTATNANWRCATNRKQGPEACCSIGINEEQLKDLSAFVMGLEAFDEKAFDRGVEHITSDGGKTFTFHFADGRAITQFWDARTKAYEAAFEKRRKPRTKENGQHANSTRHTRKKANQG